MQSSPGSRDPTQTLRCCWLMILFCCLWIRPVTSGLAFAVQPEDSVGVLGEPLLLPCAVYDADQQRVLPGRWERDSGEPIQGPGTGMHQLPNGSLFFPHLREEDLGTYICGATAGPDRNRTVVTVDKAGLEGVFLSPQSQVSTEGQPVVFQCISGDSAPPASITWEKEGSLVTKGTQIQGQYGGGSQRKTSGTLYLANISKEDEGIYACVTHNPLLGVRMESDAAALRVQGSLTRPEIAQGPENTTVPTATKTGLRCAVRGFPPPAVRWFKDGGLLQNDSRRSLSDGGQLLVFRNVSEEDEGSYCCEARNEVGIVRSPPAYLLPAVMGWDFVQQPTNMTAKRGDSATLACRPPHSRPLAAVSWFKDSQELQLLPHMALQASGDLFFHSVLDKDRGFYFCRAINRVIPRAISSVKVYLNVLAPPSVKLWPAVTAAALGSAVRLHCQVSGQPQPTVVWSKRGQSVRTGGKVTAGVRNSTLYFSSVKIYDEGSYTCEARNSVGRAQGTVSLRVTASPVIVSFLREVTSIAGTAVVLPCQAVGNAPITYVWRKVASETPISPSSQFHVDGEGALHISSVRRSHAGEYSCTARNGAGQAQKSVTVTVFAKEDSTERTKLSAVTSGKGEPRIPLNILKTPQNPQDLTIANSTSKIPGGQTLLPENAPETTSSRTETRGKYEMNDFSEDDFVSPVATDPKTEESSVPFAAQILWPSVSSGHFLSTGGTPSENDFGFESPATPQKTGPISASTASVPESSQTPTCERCPAEATSGLFKLRTEQSLRTLTSDPSSALPDLLFQFYDSDSDVPKTQPQPRYPPTPPTGLHTPPHDPHTLIPDPDTPTTNANISSPKPHTVQTDSHTTRPGPLPDPHSLPPDTHISPQDHSTSPSDHHISPQDHSTSPSDHYISPQDHSTSPPDHNTSPPDPHNSPQDNNTSPPAPHIPSPGPQTPPFCPCTPPPDPLTPPSNSHTPPPGPQTPTIRPYSTHPDPNTPSPGPDTRHPDSQTTSPGTHTPPPNRHSQNPDQTPSRTSEVQPAIITKQENRSQPSIPSDRSDTDTARVKQQPSSWLPALEKHDVPIVVGVGVSLAFIFFAMGFYSLVQKNDPLPAGRGAQRKFGAPCRRSGRLETGRTYENRAFEDDNSVAVIEQSPNTTRAPAPQTSAVAVTLDPPEDPQPAQEHQEELQMELQLARQGGLTPPQSHIQLQSVEDWGGGECRQCRDAPLPPPSRPKPVREDGLHTSLTLQTADPCATPVHHSVNISHSPAPLLLSHCISMGVATVAVDVHFYPAHATMSPGSAAGPRLSQGLDADQTGPGMHYVQRMCL